MWGQKPEVLRPQHEGKVFYLSSATETHGGANPSPAQPSSSNSASSLLNPRIAHERSEAATAYNDAAVQGLLTRLRIENERLRDQVKAHTVQETLLTQRLQELSARNTALHLQDFRKKDNNAAVEALKRQLEAKEKEIRDLQLQVGVLTGRVAAYEEAVSRPMDSTNPSERSSNHLRELICEVLSTVNYLTRVANAAEHCQPARHEGTGCPRSLEECSAHCLRAVMRGNDETPAEISTRGYRMTCEQLLTALREEVLHCETMAVRIAAQMLTERGSGGPGVQAARVVATPERTTPTLTAAPAENAKVVVKPEQKPQRTRREPVARPTMDDCEVQ
uniref:Uncharacterized protein n=1 Tax=Trypanosoma congolense (strain IL3000) TaxID=1068625 RepID=G0ULV1_TRYCI|nr:conserved hypothetical protein [Trypanosoma congolense IL3000]